MEKMTFSHQLSQYVLTGLGSGTIYVHYLTFIMMFLPEGVIVGLVEHYQRRKVRILIETEKAEASE